MMRKILCLCFGCLILFSFTPAKADVRLPVSTPPAPAAVSKATPTVKIPTPTETDSPPSTPQPDATIAPPKARSTKYTLWADFNYHACTLDVHETIVYVNTTDSQMTGLPLIIEPNRRKDIFKLVKMTWGNGTPVATYTLRNGILMVQLAKPIQPGETVELRLQYHINIPFTSGTFGSTQRQVNLANWYAFVPAYRSGPGWLIHEPGRAGEHFAYDVADYDVTIRLVGKEMAITIAAGVPAEVMGNEYHYKHNTARNFSWSASTDYIMVWSRADDVVVTGYVFPEHQDTGLLAAGFVSEALLLFDDLYGKIPHTSISFVEADFYDGMEYDGLFFLDKAYFSPRFRSARSGLASLSVHETAHQWWGALVANDQATEPWLDESLCTFSELLFYENRYPDLVEWWWDYRIDSLKPRGRVDATIYQYKDFRAYVNAVYLRGARFMDAIRDRIGEETFLAFIREYARTYAYRLATGDDFFFVLDRFSSADLGDLEAIYFHP